MMPIFMAQLASPCFFGAAACLVVSRERPLGGRLHVPATIGRAQGEYKRYRRLSLNAYDPGRVAWRRAPRAPVSFARCADFFPGRAPVSVLAPQSQSRSGL